jgi:uncharacterized membrane protein YqjE
LAGWDRHGWGDLHTWLSYAAVALVFAHLLIHSRWLWVVACQRRWPRLLAGLALGLALPAAALLWPVMHGNNRSHASEPSSASSQP